MLSPLGQNTNFQENTNPFEFKKLVDQNINKLAKIITSEHGKTIDDAKGEVLRGLEVLEFACGIPSHLEVNSLTMLLKGLMFIHFVSLLELLLALLLLIFQLWFQCGCFYFNCMWKYIYS